MHVEHVGVAQGERAQQDEVELHRDRPPCVSQSHVGLRADAVASMGSERRRAGDAPAKAAIFHASAPGNAFTAACRHETALGWRSARQGRALARALIWSSCQPCKSPCSIGYRSRPRRVHHTARLDAVSVGACPLVAPANLTDLLVLQNIHSLLASSSDTGGFRLASAVSSRPSAVCRLAACLRVITLRAARSASVMPYCRSCAGSVSSTRHCFSGIWRLFSLAHSCATRCLKLYLGGSRANSANVRLRDCESPTARALSLTSATSLYLRRPALATADVHARARARGAGGVPGLERRPLQLAKRRRAEVVRHVLEEQQLRRQLRYHLAQALVQPARGGVVEPLRVLLARDRRRVAVA